MCVVCGGVCGCAGVCVRAGVYVCLYTCLQFVLAGPLHEIWAPLGRWLRAHEFPRVLWWGGGGGGRRGWNRKGTRYPESSIIFEKGSL